MASVTRVLGACTLVLLAACGGDQPAWSVLEAESIAIVRGTPVRNVECSGERPVGDGRYRRFACSAGARRHGETLDTVAVLYDLVPRGEFQGPGSDHELENVRFVGGPGIP
jgi:hypothetical protein